MGQSINVLLYGARIPDVVDAWDLIERWEKVVAAKVTAYEARLHGRTPYSWGLARQGFVPTRPLPDDAPPDRLVGFHVCKGYHDHGESHRFPPLTAAEMRSKVPPVAPTIADVRRTQPKIIKRCRRRWLRFARWARAQGVEFGRARIWRTRDEVA